MIIHDLDCLAFERDDGETETEELGRATLSEGPWTVVAYLIRERTGGGPWRGPSLWLHRYQKVQQGWKLAGHFRTTERGQLENLARALRKWNVEGGVD
jgi:hypothetical protein